MYCDRYHRIHTFIIVHTLTHVYLYVCRCRLQLMQQCDQSSDTAANLLVQCNGCWHNSVCINQNEYVKSGVILYTFNSLAVSLGHPVQRRILSYVLFLYFSLSVCACLCLFVKASVQRICLLQSKKTQYKRTRNNLTNIYYSYTHTSWRMNNICCSFFFRCWYPLSLLLGIHTKHSRHTHLPINTL